MCNQDLQLSWSFQTMWKTVKKSKNRELVLPENDFKICFGRNSTQWLKNWILWFVELYIPWSATPRNNIQLIIATEVDGQAWSKVLFVMS